MAWFETVADEYDAARPDHPAGIYDALGPLAGLVVLEGGAGTGIATRPLLARGAQVIPFDVGPKVLQRAVRRTPGLPAVLADGARAPFRTGAADLVCFGQSWHWLDEARRIDEAARLLQPGGRWAGWWSHARADGEPWFEAYWSLIERTCPPVHRDQRDIDWGEAIAASEHFDPVERVTVPWVRTLSLEQWLVDDRSRSYIAAMAADEREALLGEIEGYLRAAFPTGELQVRYETWLWIAHRTAS